MDDQTSGIGRGLLLTKVKKKKHELQGSAWERAVGQLPR